MSVLHSAPRYAPFDGALETLSAALGDMLVAAKEEHGEIVLTVPGKVAIDGRAAGEAPGVFELAAGKHTVSIDTERYLDFSADVDIEGRGRSQRLEPQLTPAWGVVTT